MSEVTVHDVQNPAIFMLDGVSKLFEKAFEPFDFADAHEVMRWLSDELPNPDIGLLIAQEGVEWTGFAIINASPHVFAPEPHVLQLEARKRPGTRMALVAALRDWAHARGWKRVWALNNSPLPDDEYIDRFRPITNGSVKCSMIEFPVLAPGEEGSDVG